MLLRLALFLIFCICHIACQPILDLMLGDARITQFSQYINRTTALSQYFRNPTITVFVPSDEALKNPNFSENEKNNIFMAHMYLSMSALPPFAEFIGTTSNWNQYTTIKTVSDKTYYTITALESLNRFYMYSSQSTFYCNEAKIISPDNVKEKQVYHVIDRVLMNSGSRSFMDYLASNETLSISAKYWKHLNQLSLQNKVPNYKPEYIAFSQLFPGTVLVPTNDAWKKLDATLQKAMETEEGIAQLASVMTRYFIPKNLVFLRGEEGASFSYGFDTVQNSIVHQGTISKDMEVNIQGRTAKVVKANIPIHFGLVHLIDEPLYDTLSPVKYLQVNNNAFMTKLNTMGNFSHYLSGNYTILALDDATVNSLTNSDLLAAALLNSFVLGNVRLTPGKTTYTTVGNVTIRLRLQDGNHFIDSLYSQADNTWINTAKVISLNTMVGPIIVSSLSGYISSSPVACSQMLQTLNASAYESLLNSNGVKLEVGSPYTLFVPNDMTVNNFTTNFTSTKSEMMQYILQRMIIANRMVLEKRAGFFNAVTMNYAAMREKLQLTVTERNCVVSIYGVQESFSFADGGFYCYSNAPNDATRYNLIYPVPFVLNTPLAKILNLCVIPPCKSSGYFACSLLLLVITVAVVFIKSEILV